MNSFQGDFFMSNAISWFEIFVADMARAKRFYEQTLAVDLKSETFNGEPHAVFAAQGVAGALVSRRGRAPSAEGCVVYINCNGKLDACLNRVTSAGGRLVVDKTDIGEPGFIALIHDSEGNLIGLHAER